MFSRCIFIALLAVAVLVSGCAQRETDIGSDAIQAQPADSIVVVSGVATQGGNWFPQYTNGFGRALEVGDTLNLYAFFVVRFDSTGLPDSFRVDTLTVQLFLDNKYVWPDTDALPEMQIRIREIPDSAVWTENDVLPGSFAGHSDFPPLDSVIVRTSDTVFTWDVPHPDEVMHRWRAGTTHGMLVEPRTGGGFVAFWSRQAVAAYRPLLIVKGRQWLAVDSAWTDTTLYLERSAVHDAYVVRDQATEPDPGYLYVTQGFAQRMALFFPVDSLSRVYTREVIRAELHLYADTTHPARIGYPYENMVFDPGLMKDTLWFSMPDSFHASYEADVEGEWIGNDHFRLDVSGPVANWVANPHSNFGLQVRSSDELDFLGRTVFYGPTWPDSLKKPRLVIWCVESSY